MEKINWKNLTRADTLVCKAHQKGLTPITVKGLWEHQSELMAVSKEFEIEKKILLKQYGFTIETWGDYLETLSWWSCPKGIPKEVNDKLRKLCRKHNVFNLCQTYDYFRAIMARATIQGTRRIGKVKTSKGYKYYWAKLGKSVRPVTSVTSVNMKHILLRTDKEGYPLITQEFSDSSQATKAFEEALGKKHKAKYYDIETESLRGMDSKRNRFTLMRFEEEK